MRIDWEWDGTLRFCIARSGYIGKDGVRSSYENIHNRNSHALTGVR